MEFCSVLAVTEEGATAQKHTQADTAMEKSEAENDRTIMTSQINDQEMVIEEQEVTSQIEEEMGALLTQMTH